jgi:putative tricarboxylic transport membrane protein
MAQNSAAVLRGEAGHEQISPFGNGARLRGAGAECGFAPMTGEHPKNAGGIPVFVSREFAAGIFLIALGLFAYWATSDLPSGTALNFGPGMMPQGVALLVAVTGVGIAVSAFFVTRHALDRWNPRAIIAILGAVAAFGFTIRGYDFPGWKIPALGMVGAIPLAIVIGSFADAERNIRELAIYIVAITLLCVGLFKLALGLPIPLAPWLLGR